MSRFHPAIALVIISLFITSCNKSEVAENPGDGTSTTEPGNADDADDSTTTDSTGEDPLASESWYLENTGQKSFASSGGKAGEDINVKSVHASGVKGSGIRIAVSDSGVDLSHPDLKDNDIAGEHRNYASNSSAQWRGGNPYPIEGEGHGTAVTGLAAAEGWNGIGSRGIAPEAKFSGFLFIGNFHTTSSSYEAKTLDQMTGAFDIFNYSYGYAGCFFVPTSTTLVSAYKAGVKNLRDGKGAIYIKAAGNDYLGYNSDCHPNDMSFFLGNTNTGEDQNVPYVILTGAMNASGKISSYSTPGSGVWVASLGGEFGSNSPAMITTDIMGCSSGISSSGSQVAGFNKGGGGNSHCDYTSIMNGTSSAAPVLSGVVALMLSANPDLTWRDVKHILAVTADKVNYSTDALPHPSSKPLSGYAYDYVYVKNAAGIDFSNTYGFGRVNAQKAVAMASAYDVDLGEYLEEAVSSPALSLVIPDKSAVGVSHSLSTANNKTIESIQVKLSTNHTFIGDLGVQLTSPSGTTSRILLVNSNIKQSGLSEYTLLTNAFYGEKSKGSWTLKIVDGAQGNTGRITKWQLLINGH
jgi:subtilisin family serine protease